MIRLFLLGLLALWATGSRAELPLLELGVGMYRIKAEVAHTDSTRMTGLMNRTEMAGDAGMLFVFSTTARHCMWMRNTLIPLSVAFIDDKGRILNIADMQPETDAAHCATGPARYALETNAGWFAARKLGAGSRIAGIGRAPRAR